MKPKQNDPYNYKHPLSKPIAPIITHAENVPNQMPPLPKQPGKAF